MSKTVYLFSGLGADKRAFKYLDLPFDVQHIEWDRTPEKHSIELYAQTIAKQIKEDEPFCYVAVSFGGMVAQEVAKLLKPEKLILISSIKSRQEIPVLYRFLGFLKLQYLLPAKFLQKNPITNYLFGIKNKKDQRLLDKILQDTDLSFLKWTIISALNWKPKSIPKSFHIHGSKDKIIPLNRIICDKVIDDGGHFMIVDKAKEIQAEIIKFVET